MKSVPSRRLWVLLLAIGALGATVIGLAGSASATKERGARHRATIKIKLDDKGLRFSNRPTVSHRKRLTVINKTDPNQIGPHTFTLVRKGLLPTGKQELKKCAHMQLKVCKDVAKAHHVGPPPDFPTGKPNVDVGKHGWDRSFTPKARGDTWFTESKGDREARRVKARRGKTLYFFCVVHPELQGKIRVVR